MIKLMNKKLFFLFVCMLLAVPVCSQTLHAIIFANTKSPGNPNIPGSTGIGPSVTVDFERMGIEMSSISSFIGYKLKKYYYYDTPARFSRSSLERVLTNLTCQPNDIVFFYYSGHGLRAVNEESQYPEMVLKVPYGAASDSELYPLYDVYKIIKRKSPRLTIVFGDLCNSTAKGFYKQSTSEKGASTKSTSVCDTYKNLFLNVKGGIIATSSKPGQTSGCATFADGTDAGGCFTASFLDCLGTCVSKGQNVSWETLLHKTRELTKKISAPNENGEHQNPIYSTSDLTVAPPPSIPIISQPLPPISDDEQTTIQDNIADALSVIGSDKGELANRIKLITPTLSKFFLNSQAKIQVVGRDSKTIVNTTTAQKYLNYLSIATKMEQVMVVEQKDSNGKVTYLKVHEMHRK